MDASPAACDRPPSAPRVASDRTKTFVFRVSQHADAISQNRATGKGTGRINSQTPTVLLNLRNSPMSASVSVLLPAPGAAGNAIINDLPVCWKSCLSLGEPAAAYLPDPGSGARPSGHCLRIFLVVS